MTAGRWALVAVLACLAPLAHGRADSGLAVRPLVTPAAPGSGEPNLAVASDGRVLLSWVERTADKRHTLRFASRPRGGTWSAAQTIAEGGGWFVNWADFPGLAVLPQGTLFAHWLEKSGPGTYAYDVKVTTSHDGGKSWTSAVVPHRDGTQTEHGFVSMTPRAEQTMGLLWLDGRKTAGASSHGAGHGAAKGAMSLVHTTLDTKGTLGAEAVLDDRVCDCCQTDAVAAAGATVVVYRDRSDTEVRDISVVRFTGGRWTGPRPLANDGWQINGCPVNGPAIAAAGANVAAAWFTAAQEKPRVKVAFSSDSGATFGAPVVADDGRPVGRVDVAVLDGGAALVSWLEQTDRGAAVRVRRIAPDGTRGDAVTVSESSAARSSGFPRMVAAGGEVVLAWRDATDPATVRTAVLGQAAAGK